VELESALREAVAKDRLELHYQPQVEIATGRVVGGEALLRWRHAERGWVSPGVFIPVAEESDLIVAVGNWALNQAGAQIARWRRATSDPLRIAVNVSARQFRDPGFVEAVAQVARRAPKAGSSLELELTESVVIEDPGRVSAILDELRALGVGIAVDDFGTGFSSLSYLSTLPIDCLKVDRSFVSRVERGGRDVAIIQAIISLAHALDLRVLAEGVETRDQLEILRDLGCDEAQGFLFSPAVDPDAFLRQMRAGFAGTLEKGGD
jgi:EAL domain-containing protein (putative c-di-GMP-specific phosphodiesterase class I)